MTDWFHWGLGLGLGLGFAGIPRHGFCVGISVLRVKCVNENEWVFGDTFHLDNSP